MAQGCGDDMTKPNSLRRSSSDGCCLRTGSFASSRFVRPKGCAHCAHFCARAAFGPLLWSLSVATSCAGLCCRRHDFAAWIVGFLGRSGFSGNVSGGVCGRRPIRRQSKGVWDPDSSSGQPWFGGSARLWRPGLATLLIFPSYAGVEFRSGRLGRGGGELAPERPAVVVQFPMTARLRATRLRGPRAGRPGLCPCSSRPPFRSRSLDH
jgi:hypothetical protein